jgi:hypothetical protein
LAMLVCVAGGGLCTTLVGLDAELSIETWKCGNLGNSDSGAVVPRGVTIGE